MSACSKGLRDSPNFADRGQFAKWVAWATAYANNLDPLRELKPPPQ